MAFATREFLDIFLVANAGCFARELTQVEEARAAHNAARNQLDLVDARRVREENTLDAYVEADLANREGASCTCAVALEDDALEDLNTVFVAFGNFVVNADGITDAEVGHVSAQLRGFHFGDDGDRIHVS